MAPSETKDQQTDQESVVSLKRKFLRHIFILFLLRKGNRSTLKTFPEVSLVSLTPRVRTVLKFLKKCRQSSGPGFCTAAT